MIATGKYPGDDMGFSENVGPPLCCCTAQHRLETQCFKAEGYLDLNPIFGLGPLGLNNFRSCDLRT